MAIVEAFTPHAEAIGQTGGTSTGFNTTGATSLIVSISYFSGSGGEATLSSDNKSNTWIPLTKRENVSAQRFYYCLSPTVGSGHTFTISWNGIDIYAAVVIHGFTGIGTFYAESGATTGGVPGTSLQPGSLTPPMNGSLVITGLGVNTVSSVAVNSGLTLTEQGDVGGVCVTAATGWKVQSPAAAINPTWSWTSSVEGGSSMAVFTPTGGVSTFNALMIAP